jgi:hypothetical protein
MLELAYEVEGLARSISKKSIRLILKRFSTLQGQRVMAWYSRLETLCGFNFEIDDFIRKYGRSKSAKSLITFLNKRTYLEATTCLARHAN